MSHPPAHPPIALRPATPADVPEILEIEAASFTHEGERFSERRVRHLVQNPRVIVSVADEVGHCLGWSAGFAWLRGKEPWGRVYALAVSPAARGRKLGPRLLQLLIDDLRRRGAGRIFLEVRTDNPAVRLYEKFGFTPCETLPHFYGHGHHAQRMVRE